MQSHQLPCLSIGILSVILVLLQIRHLLLQKAAQPGDKPKACPPSCLHIRKQGIPIAQLKQLVLNLLGEPVIKAPFHTLLLIDFHCLDAIQAAVKSHHMNR